METRRGRRPGRGRGVDIPWRRVAATPRLWREYSVEMRRGGGYAFKVVDSSCTQVRSPLEASQTIERGALKRVSSSSAAAPRVVRAWTGLTSIAARRARDVSRKQTCGAAPACNPSSLTALERRRAVHARDDLTAGRRRLPEPLAPRVVRQARQHKDGTDRRLHGRPRRTRRALSVDSGPRRAAPVLRGHAAAERAHARGRAVERARPASERRSPVVGAAAPPRPLRRRRDPFGAAAPLRRVRRRSDGRAAPKTPRRSAASTRTSGRRRSRASRSRRGRTSSCIATCDRSCGGPRRSSRSATARAERHFLFERNGRVPEHRKVGDVSSPDRLPRRRPRAGGLGEGRFWRIRCAGRPPDAKRSARRRSEVIAAVARVFADGRPRAARHARLAL